MINKKIICNLKIRQCDICFCYLVLEAAAIFITKVIHRAYG